MENESQVASIEDLEKDSILRILAFCYGALSQQYYLMQDEDKIIDNPKYASVNLVCYLEPYHEANLDRLEEEIDYIRKEICYLFDIEPQELTKMSLEENKRNINDKRE